jgi:hypothetical protein
MVANDEREGHARALTGIYGEDVRAEAKGDTLRGLSEKVTERADCWIVEDLITNERYVRPFARYTERPLLASRRMSRLRLNYGLPLERDLAGGPPMTTVWACKDCGRCGGGERCGTCGGSMGQIPDAAAACLVLAARVGNHL